MCVIAIVNTRHVWTFIARGLTKYRRLIGDGRAGAQIASHKRKSDDDEVKQETSYNKVFQVHPFHQAIKVPIFKGQASTCFAFSAALLEGFRDCNFVCVKFHIAETYR